MAKIELQFSTENNIASKVLHWWDHTWCSHVDAVLPEGGLLGAKLLGGVCVRPNVGFVKTLKVELETTDEIRFKFYDFLTLQLGKPYDLNGIWSFFVERDWRDDDSWYCSELIAVALEKSGFLPYKLYTHQVTPENLLLICNCYTPIGEPEVR